MIHKKLLSLLVLLMTVASGAWAEEVTVTFTQADLNGTSTVTKDGVTLTPGNNRVHNGASLYDKGSTTFSVDKGTFTKIEIVNCTYGDIGGWQKIKTGSYQPDPEEEPNRWLDLYTLTWTGKAESVAFTASVWDIQSIVFTIDKPDVEVTTNKAEGETFFTEATFTMPAYDVTVNYELVRDMSVQMTTKVGDGAEGADYRIRVKKDGDGKWELADMGVQDLLGMITVHDGIEDKDLTFYGDEAVCTVSIYAVDDQGQTASEATSYQNLVPGRYVAVATAKDGSAYDGQTDASNIIVIFQGYEVEVAAGGFATFYKDEPLYADAVTSADAELYTISSVSDTQAVLSGAIQTAPSRTPLLVYNTGDEAKTFLLLPANEEPNLQLTVAPEFKGTLDAKTVTADEMADADFYVCTGRFFVWVKDDGTISANKCWLQFPKQQTPGARQLTIVFDNGETTAIDNGQLTIDNEAGAVYDLQGRRVAKPAKGVFIQNGKKVVK